jgi:hypothetical protein
MAIIDKPGADIDARFRSLLQKAVRRGNVELVFTASALIESLTSREKNWFRNRTAIITFEECWPLGSELVFNKKFHSKVAALIKVAGAQKAKGATGLGYLSYLLSEGDLSVFDGSPSDRHLRIVANAIRRPDDFWQWLADHGPGDKRKLLVENALRFRNAGRPWDRAVIQAAAYLAATGHLPTVEPAKTADAAFPYWVVLDRHTPQGKRALNDLARDLHIPPAQLEWTFYYFEGSCTAGAAASEWWERYCAWKFRKLNLPPSEAHLLWEPAKPQLKQALAEDSRRLHGEIYAWKLANRERIDTLKKQVALFIERYENGHLDQLELF